jgi:hypothetical protein
MSETLFHPATITDKIEREMGMMMMMMMLLTWQ